MTPRRSSFLAFILLTCVLSLSALAGPRWMSVRTGGTVSFKAIWGFDAASIWAVGYGGYILRWDGKKWMQESSGTSVNLHSVWGANPNDMWAVGDAGTVLRRDANGWRSLPALTNFNLSRVWGADADNVWIVGVSGVILKWNGVALVLENAGGGNGLGGLWGTDKNNVWVSGGAGTIRKWNGTSWTSQASGTTNALHSLWGTAPDNVWAAGNNGTILRWNGTSWAPQASGTTEALYHISGTGAANAWAVGFNGAILRWDGAAWNNETTALIYIGYGIWAADADNAWIVGYQGTVLKYVTQPAIGNVQASQESATQAKFEASVNPNGAPTTIRFEYGATIAYGHTTTAENIGDATVALPQAAVATLAPHTTYHYRVIATNAAGTAESADHEFALPNYAPIASNDVVHPSISGGKITVNVLSNDSDPDGDATAVIAVGNPAHGTAAIQGQVIVYTPGASFDGNDEFTYMISDGFGGTATGAVTLLNRPPQAVDDTLHSPLYAQEFFIDVLANDTDEDATDVLTISAVSQGAHGSVAIVANSIRYRPAADFAGNDAFNYTVQDGSGGTSSASVTVWNTEPLAGGDTFHLPLAPQFILHVLANDADSDAEDALVIESAENGTHGTVTTDGATVTYIPGPTFSGNDTFFYTVTDGRRGPAAVATTSRAQVRLINAAPMALPDFVGVHGEPVTVDATSNDSDPDGDAPLAIVSVTQGNHGEVSTNGTNITYTPGASFRSTDSFTYTVSDGHAGTATAKVTVQLSDVAAHLVAGPGTAVPGEPSGTFFRGYGIPSMNSAGTTVFRATFNSPGGAEGIYSSLPLRRIARASQTPPGETDAIFRSFRDPIVSEGGDFAFRARFSAPKNLGGFGIWISRPGHELERIASTNTEAPATNGARFASFGAMNFAVDGTLFFTAKLKLGGAVTGKDNLGLWAADSAGVRLVVRKGRVATVDGVPRVVADFEAFPLVPGSPGERRGFTADGELMLHLTFDSRSQSLVRGKDDGGFVTVASTEFLLAGSGSRLTSVAVGVSDAPDSVIFRGISTSATGANRKVPVLARATSSGTMEELLRTGTTVQEGVLKSIDAPVGDGRGVVAFSGTLQLQAGSITSSNDAAIWKLDTAGVPRVDVREGDAAPGRIGGKIQQFLSVAYPSERGVAFLAKLKPARGAITASNDVGLWAFDHFGELRMVVAEGESISTNFGDKTIRSITVLSSVLDSPSAGHSGTASGGFVYRLTFTDRSQAIGSAWLP